MRYQKVVGGLFFVLLISIGAFFVFHFSIFENTKENLIGYFPSLENVFKKNGGFSQGGIWSPGPLVKERDVQTRELTVRGIIDETNKERTKNNRGELVENNTLNQVAEIKLDDMFENQYFAHISPDGVGVGDIAKDLMYEYITVGDNLALGNFNGDDDVVNEWMMSPGHRRNILNDSYQEIGVAAKEGQYEGRDVWMAVQVFAMPSSACPQVDESVRRELNNKKAEAERLENERKRLEREIDAIEERGSEEHLQKVEDYNAAVRNYNNLIPELDSAIAEYNRQIKEREECISRANEPL